MISAKNLSKRVRGGAKPSIKNAIFGKKILPEGNYKRMVRIPNV